MSCVSPVPVALLERTAFTGEASVALGAHFAAAKDETQASAGLGIRRRRLPALVEGAAARHRLTACPLEPQVGKGPASKGSSVAELLSR
jgi:hypothetical protein